MNRHKMNLMLLFTIIMAVTNVTTAKEDVRQVLSLNPATDITLTKYTSHHAEHSKKYECGTIENLNKGTFTLYDYSIVLGMLVISLGIGVFYGFFSGSENTSSDFLHGTEMSLLPVSLSLTTSFITAIELLGNPSEMVFNGTQFSLIVISIFMVIPIAIKIYYPIYFKLQLTSCYEYLGIRFGDNIRIFGAILYIIQMSFYTAVSVYAPAIALSKATGLDTHLAVFLIYMVCIFYSSQGGMKAVVIADTFQATVLAFSLGLVVVLGYVYTGGFTEIFTHAEEGNRLEFLNVDPNPTTRHTVFSVVIGGFFYWTSLLCTNQASVQKCMSLKSQKKANMAMTFSIIGLVTIFIVNFYTGLTIFAHYKGCDPFNSGKISAKDEILPFYIMDVFPHLKFVNGFFVAGIFAASLGTVASALNSLAAVTSEDIISTGLNIKINPEKGAMYAKWMSLGFGILSFGLVFVVEQLGGILQATLTLNGLIGGVTLGLFSLGIFFKSANAKGALYGGLISLALVISIGVMALLYNEETKPLSLSLKTCDCFVLNSTTVHSTDQDFDGNGSDPVSTTSAIFQISYMWYSFLGTVLTILLGLLISMLTEKMSESKVMSIVEGNEKYQTKSADPTVFTVESYRRKSQMHQIPLNGIDNIALKIEE